MTPRSDRRAWPARRPACVRLLAPGLLLLPCALAAAEAPGHPAGPQAAGVEPAGTEPVEARVAEARETRVEIDLGTREVNISPSAPFYSPGVLRVRVGDTVVWRNDRHADTTHSVVESARSMFSLDVPVGGEARYRPLVPGKYRYGCRFHPWMTGMLIVEPAPSPVAWRDLPPTRAADHRTAGADVPEVAAYASWSVALRTSTAPMRDIAPPSATAMRGGPARAAHWLRLVSAQGARFVRASKGGTVFTLDTGTEAAGSSAGRPDSPSPARRPRIGEAQR